MVLAIKINLNKKKKKVKEDLRIWSVKYMDDQAVEAGFDSLLDLRVGDEDDTPEEVAETKAGRDFRKAVRSHIKQVRKDVDDELRLMPTEAELIAELPILILPYID
jgi:hypothetical protein